MEGRPAKADAACSSAPAHSQHLLLAAGQCAGNLELTLCEARKFAENILKVPRNLVLVVRK
jgi:hypothetical protein